MLGGGRNACGCGNPPVLSLRIRRCRLQGPHRPRQGRGGGGGAHPPPPTADDTGCKQDENRDKQAVHALGLGGHCLKDECPSEFFRPDRDDTRPCRTGDADTDARPDGGEADGKTRSGHGENGACINGHRIPPVASYASAVLQRERRPCHLRQRTARKTPHTGGAVHG